MDTKLELLSPAGSWESLVAAVQNGADAVYMGGTKFNARRFAENFNDDILRRAVEYAHLYGVKVYITINILIKEKELQELRDYLNQLKDYAIDGIIVQDLGAARIMAVEFPEMALHASTQMTVHQLEGARILEDMGFTRVVPARELTLEELKHITDNSSLEVETFIHGALCVSYSGQCLMSSMLGGRSGNRGMCAQPCRLPYTLNKDKMTNGDKPVHHISMKDLSTIDFLGEIVDAGVTSFKIEGRMKRPEYVAIVTDEYRKALDCIREQGYYKADEAVHKELKQIFNRGSFTKGYYYGTSHDNLTASEKPNNWGVYLGSVIKTEKNTVWLSLNEDLEIGDGIEFWVKDGGSPGASKGQTVNTIVINGQSVDMGRRGQRVGVKTSHHIDAGTEVYKTSSASQLKNAQATYANQYARRIPVSCEAFFFIGENPVMRLWDDHGNMGEAAVDYKIQAAEKKPLSREAIEDQITKLGDTPYTMDAIRIDYGDGLFLPVSILNQLRREAADDLTGKRIKYFNSRAYQAVSNRKLPDKQAEVFQVDSRPLLCGYIDNLDTEAKHLKGLDIIAFTPRSFSFNINKAIDFVRELKEEGFATRLVLSNITRMDDMDFLRNFPNELWSIFDDYQISSLGQLKLLNDKGIKHPYGSMELNVMNSMSIAELYNLGLKGVTLSSELTTGEIHDIIKKSVLPSEIIVYGRIKLMTMEYCAHSGGGKNSCGNCRFIGENILTDRLNYDFPVVKRRIFRCYTEILNSQPIFLADDMKPFNKLGAAVWGLNLERMDNHELKQVISLYRFAVDNPGETMPPELKVIAEDIKRKGFTKGHFFRGVE